MVLQTLVREHVMFALMAAQIVSSMTVMVAKAIGLHYYDYFPPFSSWELNDPGPLGKPLFWFALACQVLVVAGYLRIFRKSQLAF